MNTQFASTADGTRIAYDVTGHGPPLMLLHGIGRDRRDWHRLGYVDRLKHDFTAITIDLRGNGESSFLTAIDDYGIAKICGDVHAVADACNVQAYAAWGYSFGGNIARYLGAWSTRVKAIAMVGVPFGPAVDEALDAFISEFLAKWGAAAEAGRADHLRARQRKTTIKGRIPAWAACFQAMRSWPAIEPSAVRCPALVLVGTKNDAAFRWVEANRPALERARISVEIVEGLTHSQEFTTVAQVYPAISAFLKRHSAAGSGLPGTLRA